MPFDNVKDILLLPHRDLIIIANAGDGSLQFFNMEGQWQYSAGGTGDGPGEFRALQGLWSYVGDSLLTFDPFQQRAVVWDISGAASRTVTVANPPAGPRFVSLRGPLPDGRLVWSSPVIIDRPAGRHRIPEKILVTSASGTVQNVFGPFPGFEQSERTAPFDLGEVPFSSELLVAVREGDILISNTAQFVVTVYDAAGQRRGAFGTIIESVPVTEEWIRLDAMRKELWYKRGRRSPLRVSRLAGIPNLEYPDSFPVSGAMEIGPQGQVWIAAYALPRDSTRSPSHVWPATVSNVWYVFGPSGAALGTVTFPDRFLVLDVSREFVAGVWRDEFDVEHVRIYRLDR